MKWSKASGTPSVGRPPKVFQTIHGLNGRNTFLRWLSLGHVVGESSKEWIHGGLSYLVDLGTPQLSHLLGHRLVHLTWHRILIVGWAEKANSLYRSVYQPYHLYLCITLELNPALRFGASPQLAWAYSHELPSPVLCSSA
jgi:hypothetical protein